MSNELIKKLTEIEIPGGGGIKTDNPVVEAAIAAGIVGVNSRNGKNRTPRA
ncbi:TPA: hypothetical protein SI673_004930 [Escherichia coli]|nr:hypothetical protein [Escherichia coli]HEI2929456.1 hypothetical protein [Escherichia coli]HEI2952903.1 hypothetical protein [Escherichia coli]